MDVLTDVLSLSGVRGAVGALIEAGADWGWWNAESSRASLHAVVSGSAWLGRPGHPPLQLSTGDVVLITGGSGHSLGNDPDAVDRTTATEFDPWRRTASGAISIGAHPVQARVLCADYNRDIAVSMQVLELLPDFIHLPAAATGDGALRDTIRLISREMTNAGPAVGVVLDRLVDILLVQILRGWLEAREGAEPSWVGLLSDPVTARAVAHLHDDPSRQWTIADLAREIAVSRATLARRFKAASGQSPGDYLTRWRMDLAAHALTSTDRTLEEIAASVGYTSVYAFSRAFSRARSQPPGRFRAQTKRRTSRVTSSAASRNPRLPG